MLVSVFIVTYNQEKLISQCIEGVLMQITECPIEIIIGDDCSTDKTFSICQEYARKHTNINVLPSEKNIGIAKNWQRVLSNCNGKYIAMCEGDDYWTDPYKLQKQIDFLESNPGVSAVTHDVVILDEINSGRTNVFFKNDIENIKQAFDNFVPTCSIVLRNINLEKHFPDYEKYKILTADKTLLLGLAAAGKIKFLNEKMAVYRIHEKGVAVNLDPAKKLIVPINTNKYILSKPEYKEIWSTARKSLLVLYGNLAVLNYSRHKLHKYLKYLFLSVFQIRKVKEFKIIISDFIFMKAKQ